VDELDAADGDVHRAMVLSLQGFTAGTAENLVAERARGPEDVILHRERIGYLHHAIGALPERLRRVVTASFLDERPMAEIAGELGVTESRVSQLRAEALQLLRDGLNTHLEPSLARPKPAKEGCVARRRAAYYDQIASRGDLHSRLALTGLDGLPVAA
jgi:RNA polymerase sigma factor for flagellar operon FliA